MIIFARLFIFFLIPSRHHIEHVEGFCAIPPPLLIKTPQNKRCVAAEGVDRISKRYNIMQFMTFRSTKEDLAVIDLEESQGYPPLQWRGRSCRAR